jgi:hypothetical protein
LCTGVVGSGRQSDVSEFSVQIVEELRCLRQSLFRIKWTVQTAFGCRCWHELSDPKGVSAAARHGAYRIWFKPALLPDYAQQKAYWYVVCGCGSFDHLTDRDRIDSLRKADV